MYYTVTILCHCLTIGRKCTTPKFFTSLKPCLLSTTTTLMVPVLKQSLGQAYGAYPSTCPNDYWGIPKHLSQ